MEFVVQVGQQDPSSAPDEVVDPASRRHLELASRLDLARYLAFNLSDVSNATMVGTTPGDVEDKPAFAITLQEAVACSMALMSNGSSVPDLETEVEWISSSSYRIAIEEGPSVSVEALFAECTSSAFLPSLANCAEVESLSYETMPEVKYFIVPAPHPPPSTPPPPSPQGPPQAAFIDPEEGSALSTGTGGPAAFPMWVVGIAVGAFVMVLLFVVCWYYAKRSSTPKRRRNSIDPTGDPRLVRATSFEGTYKVQDTTMPPASRNPHDLNSYAGNTFKMGTIMFNSLSALAGSDRQSCASRKSRDSRAPSIARLRTQSTSPSSQRSTSQLPIQVNQGALQRARSTRNRTLKAQASADSVRHVGQAVGGVELGGEPAELQSQLRCPSGKSLMAEHRPMPVPTPARTALRDAEMARVGRPRASSSFTTEDSGRVAMGRVGVRRRSARARAAPGAPQAGAPGPSSCAIGSSQPPGALKRQVTWGELKNTSCKALPADSKLHSTGSCKDLRSAQQPPPALSRGESSGSIRADGGWIGPSGSACIALGRQGTSGNHQPGLQRQGTVGNLHSRLQRQGTSGNLQPGLRRQGTSGNLQTGLQRQGTVGNLQPGLRRQGTSGNLQPGLQRQGTVGNMLPGLRRQGTSGNLQQDTSSVSARAAALGLRRQGTSGNLEQESGSCLCSNKI